MKQMTFYETPTAQEVWYSYEGFICASLTGATENFNVHEETDW